jgi:hypothetical protein
MRARTACQANQAAAAAKMARQATSGNGFSSGSNIPAIATPIRTCRPSASSSVTRSRRRPIASRAAQQTATSNISAAKAPSSHLGLVMSAPGEPARREDGT